MKTLRVKRKGAELFSMEVPDGTTLDEAGDIAEQELEKRYGKKVESFEEVDDSPAQTPHAQAMAEILRARGKS